MIEYIKRVIEEHPKASDELCRLAWSGELGRGLPEITALDDVREIGDPGDSHKNNFYHSLQVLDNISPDQGPLLRWSALLHDVGKPGTRQYSPGTGWTFHGHPELGASMVPGILTRFGYTDRRFIGSVERLVELHMRPSLITGEPGGPSETAARHLIRDAGPLLGSLLTLAEADTTGRSADLKRARIQRLARVIEEVRAKDAWNSLNPVLNGTWLLEHYEFPDPSQIGTIKDALKRAIMDQGVPNTPEALLPLVTGLATELGLREL